MASRATLVERTIELPDHGSTVVGDIPGPEGAPVVLLLHGLGATGRLNWGRCFELLAQHFRVLTLDQRGHGRGLRTRRFSLEECADDAVQAAAELGARRFIAVGYSMGGPIASLTWRRHPERVAGSCCARRRGTSRRAPSPASRARRLPVAAAAARLVPGALQRGMLQRMLVRVEHPELRDRIREELLGHEPATVIQAAEALTRFSSHDWIGKVDVPDGRGRDDARRARAGRPPAQARALHPGRRGLRGRGRPRRVRAVPGLRADAGARLPLGGAAQRGVPFLGIGPPRGAASPRLRGLRHRSAGRSADHGGHGSGTPRRRSRRQAPHRLLRGGARLRALRAGDALEARLRGASPGGDRLPGAPHRARGPPRGGDAAPGAPAHPAHRPAPARESATLA